MSLTETTRTTERASIRDNSELLSLLGRISDEGWDGPTGRPLLTFVRERLARPLAVGAGLRGRLLIHAFKGRRHQPAHRPTHVHRAQPLEPLRAGIAVVVLPRHHHVRCRPADRPRRAPLLDPVRPHDAHDHQDRPLRLHRDVLRDLSVHHDTRRCRLTTRHGTSVLEHAFEEHAPGTADKALVSQSPGPSRVGCRDPMLTDCLRGRPRPSRSVERKGL